MPIQVVKGKDDENQKYLKGFHLPNLRDEDIAYLSNIDDLADLLALKVYRIDKLKKDVILPGEKQQELVLSKKQLGENFLGLDESLNVVKKSTKAKRLLEQTSKSENVHHKNFNDLIVKLHSKPKTIAEEEAVKTLLEKIQDHNSQLRQGLDIYDPMNIASPRSLDETLQWAIEYVEEHQDELATILYNVVDEVNNFMKLRKRFTHKRRGFISNADSPQRAIKSRQDGTTIATKVPNSRRGKANHPDKNLKLEEQLNKLKSEGQQRFLQNIMVGEQPDDSKKFTRKNVRPGLFHRSTLLPEAVNRFRQSKSEQGPRPMSSKSNDSNSHPADIKVTTAETIGRSSSALSSDENGNKSSFGFAFAAPPSQPPPTNMYRGGQRKFTLIQDDKDSSVMKVDRSPTAKELEKNVKTGYQLSLDIPRGGSPPLLNLSLDTERSVEHFPAEPETYENSPAKTVDGGRSASVVTATIPSFVISASVITETVKYSNEQNKKAHERLLNMKGRPSSKRYEVLKQYYDKCSDQRDGTLNAIQKESDDLAKRSYKRSKKLIDQFFAFEEVKVKKNARFLTVCKEKEFERPILMSLKNKHFHVEGDDKGKKYGRSMNQDLSMMNKKVRKILTWKRLQNLERCEWLVSVLTKLREYNARTKHIIPLSCFKFLGVAWQLLRRGWILTSDLYYQIMEATVPTSDHKEATVHKALKAARENAGVFPEVFLKYLEDRKIQPCSDFLAQIRDIRYKKARKQRAALLVRSNAMSVLNQLASEMQQLTPPATAPFADNENADVENVTSRPATTGIMNIYRSSSRKMASSDSDSEEEAGASVLWSSSSDGDTEDDDSEEEKDIVQDL